MNRETIYLAGLLHDIGKFWQRADQSMDRSTNLAPAIKGLLEQACPRSTKGYHTHLHVLWTMAFVAKHRLVFQRVVNKQGQPAFILEGQTVSNPNTDHLLSLAGFHHQPATPLQALIQLADWVSSGIDRRTPEEDSDASTNRMGVGYLAFKKTPLHSIFEELKIQEKKGSGRKIYPLEALDLQSSTCLFPIDLNRDQAPDLTADYFKLWQAFEAEFLNLPDQVDAFLESLLYLLKKYAWGIPSSTTDMANVSLYEHLKSTAAFADILFVHYLEQPEVFQYQAPALKITETYFPFLMVCGDLSGIQNFIYNIASAKAKVSLKGRSFYLQLLQEVVQQEILARTHSQSGNLIYASGGKFYLLLPHTESNLQVLEDIRKLINLSLYEKHQHRLYLCLDWIPFNLQRSYSKEPPKIRCTEKTKKGESISNLGDLWIAVTEKAAAWKGRKYHLLIEHFYDKFFGLNGQGLGDAAELEVCAVTGEAGPLTLLDPNDQEDPIWVLPAVKEQVAYGKFLKDFDTMLVVNRPQELTKDYFGNRIKSALQPLTATPYTAYFLNDFSGSPNANLTSADFASIIKINDTNFLQPDRLRGLGASYGFRFYGGNKPPLNAHGSEKLFEELARNDYDQDTFLGILRMDVDGLGQIFKAGLNSENRTFAAYATLSGALDYFFSGYINTIRDRREFRDWISIIYSGGDDLFAVGRWQEIIEFAAAIREAFRNFVGGREELSISGGIALVGKKYPIGLAAEEAGTYEERSKYFQNKFLPKTKTKNAICLFGQPISWEVEFPLVREWKNHLYELVVNQELISKGFLQKLIQLQLHKNHLRDPGTPGKNDYSYRWNAAYYLARYSSKFKIENTDHSEVIKFLELLKHKLFADHELGEDRYLDLAALAARWTEFLIKENTKPNFY